MFVKALWKGGPCWRLLARLGEAGHIPRRGVSSSWEDLLPARRWGCIHCIPMRGGDTWSSCFIKMGWGAWGGHSSSFPLPCLLLPPSVCVSMTAVTHHLHHHLLTLFSSFQASKAWRKNKMDESKHEIHSQVDAITAGTASVVNLTAGMWRVEEGCLILSKAWCLFSAGRSQLLPSIRGWMSQSSPARAKSALTAANIPVELVMPLQLTLALPNPVLPPSVWVTSNPLDEGHVVQSLP